jgi:broad specificity phosphatase PhoE
MKPITRWLLAALTLLSVASTGVYAQTVDVVALAERLKSGGYVIVFRHGATNRDQADTDPLNPGNVAKQRLLSESGRQVAKQIGEAFKTLGIPIGKTFTSKFNRAFETGRLISSGEVTTTIDLRNL